MKTLICIGEGLGNIVMATPLISAMRDMSDRLDVLIRSDSPGARSVIADYNRVDHFFYGLIEDVPRTAIYDKILIAHWYGRPTLVHDQRTIDMSLKGNFRYRSEVEVNMDLARSCGYITSTPHSWCATCSKQWLGISDCIAIAPGFVEGWHRKGWDKYPELIEVLRSRGEKVILVGAKEDEFNDWSARAGSSGRNYIGQLPNVTGTAKLISHCKMFIGNDGGLMHIANAVGVKTFGIFGPTMPSKNAESDIIPIFKRGLACRPCQLVSPKYVSCETVECMKSLSVEEVIAVIEVNGGFNA